jgi:hypothetical protein
LRFLVDQGTGYFLEKSDSEKDSAIGASCVDEMSIFQAGNFESNVITALRDFIAVTSKTTVILVQILAN